MNLIHVQSAQEQKVIGKREEESILKSSWSSKGQHYGPTLRFPTWELSKKLLYTWVEIGMCGTCGGGGRGEVVLFFVRARIQKSGFTSRSNLYRLIVDYKDT